MAISNPTKRQLAERYMIKFAGGFPSDDFKVDDRFFIQEINQAIAILAKNSAIENANVDGIMFANDQFIVPYRNIAILSSVDSEFKYSVLPDSPVGIAKGRGLVMVMPPLGTENTFKPITAREVPFLFHQSPIPKVTFYWIEGPNINYYPAPSVPKVSMKIITSGTQDLDVQLPYPPEDFAKIEEIVSKAVARLFATNPDNINDGEPE